VIALRRATVLAVDAASVVGGRAARLLWGGLGAADAVQVRCTLPVSAEPLDASAQEALATALRAAAAPLVRGGRPVVLLPAHAGAPLVLGRERGVEPAEHARFRLAASLDAPAGELVARVASAPGGRWLAVAIRRDTLASYQAALAAAGLAGAPISFALFAALAALPVPSAPRRVDLLLGDAAGTLLGWSAGALASVRCRLRDGGPDEAARWHDEIRRTAALLGGEPGAGWVLGPGAVRLGAALAARGIELAVGLPRLRVDAAGVSGEELMWPGAVA
jgi:hypothetical protein